MQYAMQSRWWVSFAAVLLGLATFRVVKVDGAAAFPKGFPFLDQPDDFRLVFEPITPPDNPAIIRAGKTPFADNAIQMRRVSIEPCGVIAAHVHPRGTEWGYMISGAIEFGMFLESGKRLDVTYHEGEGVVVPQGTVHFARNAACTRSEIVVIFDHPDPAVMYVGKALAQFPQSYLTSAFDTALFPAANNDQFFDQNCSCGGQNETAPPPRKNAGGRTKGKKN